MAAHHDRIRRRAVPDPLARARGAHCQVTLDCTVARVSSLARRVAPVLRAQLNGGPRCA